MKIPWGWFFGCGATLVFMICLVGIILVAGGTPFNPGPLSADHPQDHPISDFVAHADFEPRCDLCHAPFQGPDAVRCMQCHTDVHDQITGAQGLHGQLPNAQDCTLCHTDHKGRTANPTSISMADFPHNQLGYLLTSHERNFDGTPITCRSCHSFATSDGKAETAAVLAACVNCHQQNDAQFVADHRREMGDACLACHDGTDRLKGFNHAAVFALVGKHAQVACIKCHVDNRFRGTPRNCVQCHADPPVHRGQFGTDCASCHSVNGWSPARLVKHPFPLNHGNKGKDSACNLCHPANYAVFTCYGCHDHTPDQMARVHIKANIPSFQDCAKCHPTGRTHEN